MNCKTNYKIHQDNGHGEKKHGEDYLGEPKGVFILQDGGHKIKLSKQHSQDLQKAVV